MKLLDEIAYSSYTGPGPKFEPLLQPPAPHKSVKVYVHTPHYKPNYPK